MSCEIIIKKYNDLYKKYISSESYLNGYYDYKTFIDELYNKGEVIILWKKKIEKTYYIKDAKLCKYICITNFDNIIKHIGLDGNIFNNEDIDIIYDINDLFFNDYTTHEKGHIKSYYINKINREMNMFDNEIINDDNITEMLSDYHV